MSMTLHPADMPHSDGIVFQQQVEGQIETDDIGRMEEQLIVPNGYEEQEVCFYSTIFLPLSYR